MTEKLMQPLATINELAPKILETLQLVMSCQRVSGKELSKSLMKISEIQPQ